MEAHIHDLTPIAIVMTVALLGGLVLMRVRQPAIVGYIFAGILLGPTGMGLVETTQNVALLAELGVIMLLFLIGMEMSLKGFKTIYKIAVATAGLQVLVSLGVFWLLGLLFGWSAGKIIVFGFAVSISSTAVAIKILEETGDLRNQVGRTSVGVLIAQDLTVIPMLLIIAAMGATGESFDYGIFIKLFVAVGFLVGLTVYFSHRDHIRLPLSDSLESRPDILPLAGLAVCFTLAALSGLMGLSAAYGAFIAGLIIGNSNLRTSMHDATLPIQSVLLMVFFLSIGLLIDLNYLFTNLHIVIPTLLFVTVGKTAANIMILRLQGEPWERAFETGVVLGQAGEFSFIIISTALAAGLISDQGYRLMVTVIALSLMISPIWLSVAHRIHEQTEKGLTSLRDMIDTTVPKSVKLPQKIDEMIDRASERSQPVPPDGEDGYDRGA